MPVRVGEVKTVYQHISPYLTKRDKKGLLIGLTGSGALIASSLLLALKKSKKPPKS